MDIEKQLKRYEARVNYLEENRRYIQNALEMALSIGDFQEQINRTATPLQVLKEAEKRVRHLMKFSAHAFYLVDPESSDFSLSLCEPADRVDQIEREMSFMIEKGLVAWAIREKKGMTIPSQDFTDQVLLHIIATNSRVRGMLVGLFADNADSTPDVSRDLISLVMRNTANALESIEHYERIKTERLLRESKERIEAILFSIPTGIVILDAKTYKIVDANAKAEVLIGCSRKELIGADYQKYNCLPEQEHGPITNGWQSRENFEGTLIAASGEDIPVLKSVIPVLIGEQECLIESFIDIRDQKSSESDRMQKEKLQGVIELAGAVCHEMNQPMQAVSGHADLLMLDVQPEDRIHKRVASIAEQVTRMGEITKKLMSITRYKTKDYLSGQIFDIEQAASEEEEPLPASHKTAQL
ncbi:MAG: PAS domain S-box protein [Desulfobacterales bacterium]|nr:PAS domain S-box protein [Desulfobacterales bacterium]